MKELEQFLLDRAMEHDSPTLLFSLAREYLVSVKVIRPGAIVLAKMIGTARKGAGDLTAQLVGHLLTGEVRADLDRMLRVDDFLGNATDLPVTEHATDTHGATLINFALFVLVGKALTPRMRDLTRVTLVRDDTPAETARAYPHAGPLLGARWNEALIGDCWPDLLRMAGSLKYGQATASLIVGKWSVEAELAKLDGGGWRPLRAAQLQDLVRSLA